MRMREELLGRPKWANRALVAVGALALAAAAMPGPVQAKNFDRDRHHAARSVGIPGTDGGVVTTSEPIAAQVGGSILREGGNAIDAAAAIAFALNVVEPQSAGIGGGGFMMVHLARSGHTFVVDTRERAPAAATPNMFENPASPGSAVGFGVRSTSGYAVGVPGMVRGLAQALDQWGTISFSDALAPAIDLAENGFLISSRFASSIPSSRLQSDIGSPAYDEARNVFLPGGSALQEGDLLVQPALARTLKLLSDFGPNVFYHCGFDPANDIAQAIVDTQLNTRAGNPSGVGRMTCEDLANYEVSIRQPVRGRYRNFEIVSMPPPSSGGLTVIQILKLLEQFPIGDEGEGFGFGTGKTLHVMAEAMRLAFADRAVWMGDTDFVDLPVNGLINDSYIATRESLINPDGPRMPNSSAVAGDPRPFDFAGIPSKVKLAAVTLPDEEGLNTTHFSVVDRHGNVVTYTNTIESAWGTGLMVPGFGFLLNNELTDFNSLPTANPDPANFDPGANDVAPNKRPRSSMAPTMIFYRGRPLAAFGSPGGSTIINSVLNVTLNLIDHQMTAQEAVDAPRLSQTSATGSPSREIGFDPDEIQALRDLGHNPGSPGEIGSVQLVVIDQFGDKLQYGAADKRRIGGVVSLPERKARGRWSKGWGGWDRWRRH